jgi:hypothetical protein
VAVILGLFGRLTRHRSGRGSSKPEFPFDSWALHMLIFLAVGTALGGWNLRTKGGRSGDDL